MQNSTHSNLSTPPSVSRSNKAKEKNGFWDWFGISLSALCIAHCIIFPALLYLAPSFIQHYFPGEDRVHIILMVFILGVAGIAFFTGYRVHGQKKPILWMLVGALLIIYATYFAHGQTGHLWEPFFAILGGICLIIAHYLNHRHCKICDQHHTEHHHDQKETCNH